MLDRKRCTLGFRFSHFFVTRVQPRVQPTTWEAWYTARHGRPGRFRIVAKIIKDLQFVQGEKGPMYRYATEGRYS